MSFDSGRMIHLIYCKCSNYRHAHARTSFSQGLADCEGRRRISWGIERSFTFNKLYKVLQDLTFGQKEILRPPNACVKMHHRDQEILHSMLQVHDVAIGLHPASSRFTDNWKRSESRAEKSDANTAACCRKSVWS